MNKIQNITISKSPHNITTHLAGLSRTNSVSGNNDKNETDERPEHERKPRKMVPNTDKGGQFRRKPYFIFERGLNFTPKPLHDNAPSSASDKLFTGLPSIRPLGISQSSRAIDLLESASGHSLRSTSTLIRRSATVRTSISFLPMASPDLTFTSFNFLSDQEESIDISWQDSAPSMFRLREDPPPRKPPIETSITVNLTETKNVYHLQLPSEAASITDDLGQMITESNSLHQTKAQTSKTKTDTATQTARVVQKACKLFIPRNKRATVGTFASIWDIYDCTVASRESIKSLEDDAMEDVHDEESVIEFEGHRFNLRFLNALMAMQRLINYSTYSEKQILYRGLMLQDPLSTDVTCNYTLSFLWTFKSEHTKSRKVTSLCWSYKNHNILAVGYGKWKYTDKCNGLVCIWNVKNPSHPEKHFYFDDPVTYVNFSRVKAQILAVSFYSGLVLLLDISSKSLMITASNRHYPLYYPVWQVHWFYNEEKSTSLSLLTCCNNGRIHRYKKTKFFLSKSVMLMSRPYGNVQGVELPRKCYPRKTLINQNPSVEVLVRHPHDPLIYLVGTSEGCVYTCSINHRHDHIDVFVAHHGPVYAIQYNPFCHKIFLTCGADWYIRIWAETIYEPLITLESGMAVVYNAVWNPLNSTIIVNTTGHFIEVWDIRRKVTGPKSTTESPSRSFNTVLKFTENKFNVSVGDADGNVHIMALTNMPFSPTFQEEILVESILNVLISQTDLLYKLRRLGPPFSAPEESSYRAKMYRKLNNLHKSI